MILYVEYVRNKRVFDEVDYVLFTSPSTVNNMIDMLGIEDNKRKEAYCNRTTNSKGNKVLNDMECYTCKKHSEEGFLKEIIELKEAENV